MNRDKGSKSDMSIAAIELPMENIAEFCHKWQVTEFALFGSILRDDFRPDSDIDVMVQFHLTNSKILCKAGSRSRDLSFPLG
ncbi:nucleotidyltransferase family protein [Leptolyngbya boryana]|jgi:predicted nucleotidyltransferase|nr:MULTISPECIES: nucleotidyltransferase domain-containing protein [Leptolyngbya]ULP32336.1 nucleotidyltransferase domain-containing protein [Leptolyngbya boryana IU 594]BAS58352.1 nucleotidyltransferase [Leptolyngbya boryana IAM M-101]BAS64700.1 nucleotidyltransferase [Leptolyngbya boryana dg5]